MYKLGDSSVPGKHLFLGGEIHPKKAVVPGKAAAKAGWMQKPEIKLGE